MRTAWLWSPHGVPTRAIREVAVHKERCALAPRHVGESGLSLSEDVGVSLFLDSLAVEGQDFQGLFPAWLFMTVATPGSRAAGVELNLL